MQESKGRNVGVCSVCPAGQRRGEQLEVIDRFVKDPSIGVLMMDTVGAVGLDLSFVSHVFLLEPLLDRSLEEQVWRGLRGSESADEKGLGGAGLLGACAYAASVAVVCPPVQSGACAWSMACDGGALSVRLWVSGSQLHGFVSIVVSCMCDSTRARRSETDLRLLLAAMPAVKRFQNGLRARKTRRDRPQTALRAISQSAQRW
eukprot:365750-Chlamydomonas_euryale.AAC.17